MSSGLPANSAGNFVFCFSKMENQHEHVREEKINPSIHYVCTTTDSECQGYICDETGTQILMGNKTTGNIFFAAKEIVERELGISSMTSYDHDFYSEHQHGDEEEDVPSSSPSTSSNGAIERNSWSKEDTILLINEYKKSESLFNSATTRNSTVWQKIAKVIKCHTAVQCENKFKYLKAQYVKKIENMGDRNTGGTVIRCNFFNELDDIFRNKPNIHPVAIASTSATETEERRGSTRENTEEEDDMKMKKRKTSLQIQLEQMDKKSEDREKNRQKRHEENIKKKEAALEVFSGFCEKIIDIMSRNTK